MSFLRTSLFITLTVLMTASPAWSADESDIVGHYWNPDRDGIVEIYSDGNLVHGRVVWSASPLIDENNRDASLKGRDMLGVPFLTNFSFDGEDRWKAGRAYAPDNGRTYKGSLWLEAGDLKMRGFIGVSALGRTATFARYPFGAVLPEGGYRFDATFQQGVEQP